MITYSKKELLELENTLKALSITSKNVKRVIFKTSINNEDYYLGDIPIDNVPVLHIHIVPEKKLSTWEKEDCYTMSDFSLSTVSGLAKLDSLYLDQEVICLLKKVICAWSKNMKYNEQNDYMYME